MLSVTSWRCSVERFARWLLCWRPSRNYCFELDAMVFIEVERNSARFRGWGGLQRHYVGIFWITAFYKSTSAIWIALCYVTHFTAKLYFIVLHGLPHFRESDHWKSKMNVSLHVWGPPGFLRDGVAARTCASSHFSRLRLFLLINKILLIINILYASIFSILIYFSKSRAGRGRVQMPSCSHPPSPMCTLTAERDQGQPDFPTTSPRLLFVGGYYPS